MAWFSGALGAFLLHGTWPRASIAGALAVLPLLLIHPATPVAAWPADVEAVMPGALTYYGVAGVVSAATAWIVATVRRPEGALVWAPPHPARRGFAPRRDVRRRLDGRAARRAWTLLTVVDPEDAIDQPPR